MATTSEQDFELKWLFDKYRALENRFSYDDITSGNIPRGSKAQITRAYNRFHDMALSLGFDLISKMPEFMKPSNSN